MVTVFSNFFINDEERFLRLKDSFESIKDIKSDNWVINCRGSFSDQVNYFLSQNLNEKLIFSNIDNKKNWYNDTFLMLKNIKKNHVFYWIEDNICVIDSSLLNKVLIEFINSNCDHLQYSFWQHHIKHKPYQGFLKFQTKSLNHYYIDKDSITSIQARDNENYIISLAGVFSFKLFEMLLTKRSPFFRRWPKTLPFDMEKRVNDKFWLPIKISMPKFELFATIDDDMGGVKGSLISRGLYPNRVGEIDRTKKSKLPIFLINTKLGLLIKNSRRFILNLKNQF